MSWESLINKPFGEHIIILKKPVGQGRFFVRFWMWPAAHGRIFVGESSWVRKKQLCCLRFWATGRPRDNITIRFREAPVILSVFSWIQGNFPCFYTHQSPGVLRDIAIFSWTTCEHSIFRKHRHCTTQIILKTMCSWCNTILVSRVSLFFWSSLKI